MAQWYPNVSERGNVLDYYDKGEQLGSGATSTVYQVSSKSDKTKQFAMKQMKKDIDKKIVNSEIGILLNLKHSNIIRLIKIFEDSDKLYLILELVTGGELFDRIVEKSFYCEKEAQTVLKQLLEALKYLHEKGITHRDLKPENLLYATEKEDSDLKLADFGLSKMMTDKTNMNTVCGTPGYCAPEVLNGKQYDNSIDMWAVGVIAYILLCGFEPFYDESETKMFQKILKCDFAFTPPWWDDISESAKDFVKKLIILRPEKRMTAAEALNHTWISGLASKVELKSQQNKLKEFNSRRKMKVAQTVVSAVTGFMSSVK